MGRLGQSFAKTMEYFEWLFHSGVAGVGNVFSGISSLIVPTSLVRNARKKQAERRADRDDPERRRLIDPIMEAFEYFFHMSATRLGTTFRLIGQIFVPTKLVQSTERAVARKTASLWWKLESQFGKLAERYLPKWLRTLGSRLLWPISSLLSFVRMWTITRDYRQLLRAVPALVLLLPVAASGIFAMAQDNSKRVLQYQRALQSAIENEDAKLQELCVSKLSQLGYQKLERAEFQNAVALSKQEANWDQAVEKMRALAPLDDGGGFAAAHLWLAENLARGKIRQDKAWTVMRSHAQLAFDLAGRSEDNIRNSAQVWLAEADLHDGRKESAIERLEAVVKDMPFVSVLLMDQCVAIGNLEAATRAARRVDTWFENKTRAFQRKAEEGEPTDEVDELTAEQFAKWAQANRLLKQSEKESRLLREGIEAHPDDAMLKSIQVALVAKRLAALPLDNPQTTELSKQLLTLKPDHLVPVSMLAKGMIQRDPAVAPLLTELRKAGVLSARAFMVVGDEYSKQQDYAAALNFYRQASEVEPTSSRAWNNVAWLMSNVDALIELDAALTAATTAIELNPDPRYYETRGQIYTRMKRWQEAIPDLERALNGNLPDAKPTHSSLANAYEQVGDLEQAAAHRKLGGTE